MRIIIVAYILSLTLVPTLAANDVSPKDFDLACAVTTVAELNNPTLGDRTAYIMFAFYMGRLTARDDSTHWRTVVAGRLAELKDKARSGELFQACADFFFSKTSPRQPAQ